MVLRSSPVLHQRSLINAELASLASATQPAPGTLARSAHACCAMRAAPSTPARLLSSLGNAGATAPLPCLTAVTQRATLHDRPLRKWGLEHLLVGALTAVTPVPCASTADVAGPHVGHRWTVDSVLPPVETLVL